MVDIRFDTVGKIKKGDYQGWYVKVVDDSHKSGGYFIYLIQDIDNKNSEGYDEWLETLEIVRGYFIESNWEIEWDIK